MYFGPQPCLPSPVSIIAAMTALHTRKDPLPRGVSPTPSKIPILSQRCSEFSSVKSCSLDQENQDPRKPPLSTQRPLIDSAGLKSKTLHQKEKSQRSGSTQLRNPLEELKPSSERSNVGLVSQPQTEALRAIEFVADPTALATILSDCSVFSVLGSQDPYPSAGTCQGFLLLKTGGIRTPRPTTEFRGSESTFRTFLSSLHSPQFTGAKKRDMWQQQVRNGCGFPFNTGGAVQSMSGEPLEQGSGSHSQALI
ncbi:Troap [Lemmus lemmus]